LHCWLIFFAITAVSWSRRQTATPRQIDYAGDWPFHSQRGHWYFRWPAFSYWFNIDYLDHAISLQYSADANSFHSRHWLATIRIDISPDIVSRFADIFTAELMPYYVDAITFRPDDITRLLADAICAIAADFRWRFRLSAFISLLFDRPLRRFRFREAFSPDIFFLFCRFSPPYFSFLWFSFRDFRCRFSFSRLFAVFHGFHWFDIFDYATLIHFFHIIFRFSFHFHIRHFIFDIAAID